MFSLKLQILLSSKTFTLFVAFLDKMTSFLRISFLLAIVALMCVFANAEISRAKRYTAWGDFGAMISPFNSYSANHARHPCKIEIKFFEFIIIFRF